MLRFRRTLLAAALAVGLVTVAADPVLAAPKTLSSTYMVQPGDSLYGIAFKVNVRINDLLAANKLVLTSLILPGRVLIVPVGAASVATAPAAPTTTAPKAKAPLVYTVVKNDYLTAIAARLQVPLRSLLVTNHLQLNSLIWPGMLLTVPAGGKLPSVAGKGPAPSSPATSSTVPPTVPPPAAVTYLVVRGDSLYGIAGKLGVRVASLLAVNQLSVTSVIHPDMKLVVPAGGTLPKSPVPPSSTSTSTSSTVPKVASSGPVPPKVSTVLAFVRAQLGKPYKAFMAGPDSYDCSGLTMAGYLRAGISLPHYSGAQIAFGTAIDWTTEPIRPGDLVFLETAPGSGVIGHVGIATSATTWIHAPRTGDVVREGSIPMSRVVGVRRLVNG